MQNTLDYIFNKFNIDPAIKKGLGIEIPNFGRDQLAELFYELGFNLGAEIGVEQGEYSSTLLEANPNSTLYSVDAWEPHRGYRDHTSKQKLDKFFEITQERLSKYGERSKIIKGYSMDAVKLFEDNELDFVYIDADHSFITAANDIFEWSKKVRKGGIIAGHDYIDYGHVHIKQLLPAYTKAYKIAPWFVLGREEKDIPGEVRDDSRSWMWVKE